MEVDEIKNKWLKFYHLLPKARIFNVSNVPCFQLVLTIIITIQSEQRAREGLEMGIQSVLFPSLIISMVEYERVRQSHGRVGESTTEPWQSRGEYDRAMHGRVGESMQSKGNREYGRIYDKALAEPYLSRGDRAIAEYGCV